MAVTGVTGSHLSGHHTHWSNPQGVETTGEMPIKVITEAMAQLINTEIILF